METNQIYEDNFNSPFGRIKMEILSDKLADDAIVIRMTDSSSRTLEMPMPIFDAKELAADILTGDLDLVAESHRERSKYAEASGEDFMDGYQPPIYSHFCAHPSDDFVDNVPRTTQMRIYPSDWRCSSYLVEMVHGYATGDGTILDGHPITEVLIDLPHSRLRRFAHGIEIAINAWASSRYRFRRGA